MIYFCAWCKSKYRNSAGNGWKPVTKKVLQAMIEAPHEISHGICKSCFEKEMRRLDEEEADGSALRSSERMPESSGGGAGVEGGQGTVGTSPEGGC